MVFCFETALAKLSHLDVIVSEVSASTDTGFLMWFNVRDVTGKTEFSLFILFNCINANVTPCWEVLMVYFRLVIDLKERKQQEKKYFGKYFRAICDWFSS
jgi:hypothetical protein